MATLGRFFLASASCLTLAGFVNPLHAQDYVAQPGDTLGSIAQSQLGNPNRWQELCTLNQLANCDVVQAGQTIRLPAAAAAVESAAPAAPTEAPAVAEPTPAPAATAEAPVAPVMSANLLPNAELAGAAAGQVGQNGTLPTGWNLGTSSGSDLELTVLDSSPGSVTLAVRQTQSEGWAQLDLSPRGNDRLTATAEQMFQANAKIEMVSGNLDSGARLQLGLMHYQPDDERLRPDLYFTTALPLAEAAEGFTGSITTTPTETATVGMFLRILFDGPFEGVLRVSDLELLAEAGGTSQSDN